MESHPSSSTATPTPRPVLVAVLVLATVQIAVAMVHEAELARLCSHYRHQHEESSTSSPHDMPSWCSQILQSLIPPPPPPDEVDPRYGVEKRLVPTGPNPLHN
ncbi:hypothetical protein BHE74_00027160 [Ensete ventricosum]|uniref:Uncharacterized protein n=1 Tax=Ensete ventricosum TaxID=4639 RepID=A0A426Z4V9_ENSVE|nr:hypothetical protein B296_00046180 [Ensete ventricosum]RWW65527.1 hypothetical protein BHE74_00027160 [Ensete ventricosum]RZR95721.1 hypothetical protein BHM03_00024594 [Ensete ventricosum]